MSKCELNLSKVLMVIGALVLLWFVGKLLGASFFLIAAVVVIFLLALIAYLVIRLYDEELPRGIKHCLRIAEPKKEEEN